MAWWQIVLFATYLVGCAALAWKGPAFRNGKRSWLYWSVAELTFVLLVLAWPLAIPFVLRLKRKR